MAKPKPVSRPSRRSSRLASVVVNRDHQSNNRTRTDDDSDEERLLNERRTVGMTTSSTTRTETTTSKAVVAVQGKRARKTFPTPAIRISQIQQQNNSEHTFHSILKRQLDRSIQILVSSVRSTFEENMASFIDANASQVLVQKLRSDLETANQRHGNEMMQAAEEVTDLKLQQQRRISQLKAEHENELARAKEFFEIDHTECLERRSSELKKRMWCCVCGSKIESAVLCCKQCVEN